MERCELHLHTEYSIDCRMKPQSVVAACVRRGITTLFVTDHNEIEGAQRIQAMAPFRVVLSEEITTSEGEIIGYFLNERIEPYQTPEATIQEIRRQGGLVSIPHPFDRLRHSAIRRDALERIINQVDILEVFNSRNVFSSDDEKAREYASMMQKLPIAVSDAHSPWEVGRSTVELGAFDSPSAFLLSLAKANLKQKRSPLFVHAITKWNKFAARLHNNAGAQKHTAG